MATIEINTVEYDSYSSVADADSYLGADIQLADDWDARTDTQKGRALISATRYLQALSWAAGEAPDVSSPPDNVRDACAVLGALVAQNPALLNGASPGSNVKKTKAGSAEVEFFSPQDAKPLPDRVMALLSGLLSYGGSAVNGFDAGAELCEPDRDGDTYGINLY